MVCRFFLVILVCLSQFQSSVMDLTSKLRLWIFQSCRQSFSTALYQSSKRTGQNSLPLFLFGYFCIRAALWLQQCHLVFLECQGSAPKHFSLCSICFWSHSKKVWWREQSSGVIAFLFLLILVGETRVMTPLWWSEVKWMISVTSLLQNVSSTNKFSEELVWLLVWHVAMYCFGYPNNTKPK